MSVQTGMPIRESRRHRTFLPEPQGLSVMGSQLLVSFRANAQLHMLDLATSRSRVWASTPGTAWGLTSSPSRVFAVCPFGSDEDRYLFEFDLDGRQVRDPIRCPGGTGSYLAHDGRDLYLSQWYEQRVFRLTRNGTFEQLFISRRGICGIAAVEGSLMLLTTADENTNEYYLERYDLANLEAGGFDVATIPFRARSLLWTGSEFLTNHRESGEIVAFTLS
jgi:hypothetical protein